MQNLFGLSTQSTDYQREAVERLHLPFSLLSDADMSLTSALALPTFEVEQMVLIRRLTLIIDAGVVVIGIDQLQGIETVIRQPAKGVCSPGQNGAVGCS